MQTLILGLSIKKEMFFCVYVCVYVAFYFVNMYLVIFAKNYTSKYGRFAQQHFT